MSHIVLLSHILFMISSGGEAIPYEGLVSHRFCDSDFFWGVMLQLWQIGAGDGGERHPAMGF